MKVCLVTVPFYVEMPPWNRGESLGVCNLAAVLRQAGITVDIVDAALYNLDAHQAAQLIADQHYDLIGFSLISQLSLHLLSKIVGELRGRGIRSHLTVGGHFPTLTHAHVLRMIPGVDSVVRGEGEATILDLAQALAYPGDLTSVRGLTFRQNSELVVNSPRPLLKDLDGLPFPARDSLPFVVRNHYFASMASSRGCYGRCTFCSIRSFYQESEPGFHWRPRSAEGVVEELAILVHDYGVSHILFVDDNFVGTGAKGRARAHRIADEIIRRQLKVNFTLLCRANDVDLDLMKHLEAAGLLSVDIGVESMITRCLRDYRKDTTPEDNRRALRLLEATSVGRHFGMMMFDQDTTLTEVRINFEFIRNRIFCHHDDILAGQKVTSRMNPYFGSEFAQILRRQGLLVETAPLAYDYVIRDDRAAGLYILINACNKAWVEPVLFYLSEVIGLYRRFGAFARVIETFMRRCMVQIIAIETSLFDAFLTPLERVGAIALDALLTLLARARARLSEVCHSVHLRQRQFEELNEVRSYYIVPYPTNSRKVLHPASGNTITLSAPLAKFLVLSQTVPYNRAWQQLGEEFGVEVEQARQELERLEEGDCIRPQRIQPPILATAQQLAQDILRQVQVQQQQTGVVSACVEAAGAIV